MTHAHIEFKAESSEEEAVIEALGRIGEPEPFPVEFIDALKYTQHMSPAKLRLLYETWKRHKGIS